MKLASLMASVEATRPPTLTEAPLPNRMPLGLTRNTLPLDDRLPRMLDGLAPTTRFSATELLPGCTNCTDSPAWMPKLCQLMATLGVVWVMTMAPGVPPMLALPAETTPPAGSARTLAPQAIIRETARIFRPKPAWAPAPAVQEEIFLPALRVFSETATKVPVWSFQMER